MLHAARRSLAAAPIFLLLASVAPGSARGDEPDPAAPAPPAKLTIELDGKKVVCREQGQQAFMVRGNWFPNTKDQDRIKDGRKMLEQSIKYRTETYGYFEGFGLPSGNAHPPKFYAKTTTFMGLNVQVHQKIIPALKCVEAALNASPTGKEYTPRSASTLRFKNTYRGVEVSNHVYGIAIDIEPDRNKCCNCVKPWNDDPICKKTTDVWKRMAMPKSWVDTFEKYGFYWLGHDVLQDTMHFEFLGDPEKITENP